MEVLRNMSKSMLTLVSLSVFVLILLIFSIGGYNNLVSLEENVSSKGAYIDTQLKRRADLTFNLLETVKAYAKHETSIVEYVSSSREKLAGATTISDKAQASSELSNAMNRLMLIVENYPDLKADKTFTGFMDELSGLEGRIAVARKDYNDAVRDYNRKSKVFPTVIIANLFGFKQREYFQANEGDKEVPNVNFN